MADELYVTPAAVSHQIKVLEAALNIQLFVRYNPSIELTEQGLAYLNDIQGAIQTIKSVTGKLLTGLNFESLTIHSTPVLTNNVLAANVKIFNSQFPELAIVVGSKIQKVDLMSLPRTSIHLALRLGKGEDDSLVNEAITPIHISPLCSKGYSQQNSLTKINLLVV